MLNIVVARGGYSNIKVVYMSYMCHEGLKIWGLGCGPLLKIGREGVRTGPHVNKRVLELKITKKHIFLKGVSFRATQVEKEESLEAANTKNWGLPGGTYPYCPNMGVSLPGIAVVTSSKHILYRFCFGFRLLQAPN